MEMRRKDLAVTDPAKIDAIIQGCDCIRLAFADGTHPYIVPLSFGYVREGDTAKFYFHGAANGRKVDLSRKLAYAGFESLKVYQSAGWQRLFSGPLARWSSG